MYLRSMKSFFYAVFHCYWSALLFHAQNSNICKHEQEPKGHDGCLPALCCA